MCKRLKCGEKHCEPAADFGVVEAIPTHTRQANVILIGPCARLFVERGADSVIGTRQAIRPQDTGAA
jgi:hypothetical protein